MYNTSGAVIRQDLNILVQEAAAVDQLFIGSRVLPPLSVDVKSGTYPRLQIAAGELLSNVVTERSRGSSYGKITRAWTTDSYDCIDRGLEEAVDDTDAKDLSRFFNLEAVAGKLVLRNILLSYELRVVAAVMNATNFGAATNSSVAYTAANLATINFPSDVVAAIRRVNNNGARANTIVIPGVVFDRLVLTTLLQNWVRGNAQGQLNAPMNAANIAASFRDYGIEQVLIGASTYNSARKGAAASMTAIWPVTNIWVGQVNAGAMSPQDGGAGFTFYWNKEGGLYVTETYRDETSRSNMVRVRQNTTEKIVDGTAGTLIATQYS